MVCRILGAALLAMVSAIACRAANLATPAQQQTREEKSFEVAIRRIIERQEFRHSEFGIDILSLETGRHLHRLNADKFFAAGSTTKLLTAATALDLLGEDFRFHTRVYRTGPILNDGTLDADIVLVASGDPNLSARVRADGTLAFENRDHDYLGPPVPGDPLAVLRSLSAQIAAQGIKRVRGRVLIDTSLYPERDVGAYVVSPFAVNDNLIDIAVHPGPAPGSSARIEQSPATSYLKLVNQVTTDAENGGKSSNADPAAPTVNWGNDTVGAQGTREVVLSGSIQAGRAQPEYFPYLVREPRRFGEHVLAQLLAENGISSAHEVDQPRPDFKALAASYVRDSPLAEHVSVALSEEVRLTLKVSQNLHAYMLDELLNAHGGGENHQGTAQLKRQFLQRLGADPSGAQKVDAAGADTQFTPEFMVSFLAKMANHRSAACFQRALPVLGRDGTLAEVQQASPAAGHVLAKTGTNGFFDALNQKIVVSKALAGYMTTRAGRRLAFAIYVRDVPIESWGKLSGVSEALGEIAALAYEVD